LRGGRTLSLYLREISGGDLTYGPKKRHLTFKQLLGWIDSHHMRTGEWPHIESGRVAEAPDLAWATIHARLKKGDVEGARERSLTRILRDHRGIWDSRGSVRLSPALVLKWADQHFARTGEWPITLSGPVQGRKGEMWCNIDVAMRNARRGYPRRQSLSQLLQDQRGEMYRPTGPQLTVRQVVDLAAAHERRYGVRPTAKFGEVHRLPGVMWSQINNWLRFGQHGLRGGQTLAEVLDQAEERR